MPSTPRPNPAEEDQSEPLDPQGWGTGGEMQKQPHGPTFMDTLHTVVPKQHTHTKGDHGSG